MKESVERVVMFTADGVEEWCGQNDNRNGHYLDEDVANDGPFGEQIVPPMMLLDAVSGAVSALSEDNEIVVPSAVTAARFRDPALIDETLNIRVEVSEEGSTYTSVDFEIRAPERGSLVAHGVISLVVK